MLEKRTALLFCSSERLQLRARILGSILEPEITNARLIRKNIIECEINRIHLGYLPTESNNEPNIKMEEPFQAICFQDS
jgi:hypothetical protein